MYVGRPNNHSLDCYDMTTAKSSSCRALASQSTGRGFNCHPQSTESNFKQVANLQCAQANSASYPQWDAKLVAYLGWATG